MENREGWERLGRLLVNRRIELGFPKRARFAKEKGFANDRVLFDLENAKRDNYGPGTVAQVERAYGWAAGSIAAVLEGGDPRPISESAVELVWGEALQVEAKRQGTQPTSEGRRPPDWVWLAGSETDLRSLNLDELAEHWAVVDFEASRAGREYARRRGITFAAAREELYQYLHDGGLPSDDHPEADRPTTREQHDAGPHSAPMTDAGGTPAQDDFGLAARKVTRKGHDDQDLSE